jgi:hypothetical protein
MTLGRSRDGVQRRSLDKEERAEKLGRWFNTTVFPVNGKPSSWVLGNVAKPAAMSALRARRVSYFTMISFFSRPRHVDRG